MKFKLFLAMILAVALLAACAVNDDENGEGENDSDVVTAASFVDTPEEFALSTSENGTWIVIPNGDLTIEEEVVVEGTFYNNDDEDSDLYRKIAAYTQDDDRNIIDQWTITVPQLTIQSENTNFHGGILDGDIYVEANGFLLHETSTVEGDLIFANEEYEASADVAGTVNGEIVVE
ncbi:hypothetical protein J2T56_001812 [Natronobacillus azotifigens]|uniref:Polymer-forming cytoskeletal protein n=1 Tax=Natronobacillus azotifigens TaxID=472978 RepID=A0A9J6RDZ3_9BACI|nr:hypothetical protein [Natronobacillus azotifigens]MCZ0703590.1 hypothetical protein [Natronobacillus azotifigens]